MHNQDNKLNVTEVLAWEGITYEHKLLWSSDWVWKRVKRYIPAPEILYPHVSAIFQKYGPLLDATTGQPLFNDAAWEVARHILENIRLGYYSDPLGVTLYCSNGVDSNGLALYQCLWGTNNIEGGVHQNITKCFGSYNASPQFAVNLICNYCYTHNINVSYSLICTGFMLKLFSDRSEQKTDFNAWFMALTTFGHAIALSLSLIKQSMSSSPHQSFAVASQDG